MKTVTRSLHNTSSLTKTGMFDGRSEVQNLSCSTTFPAFPVFLFPVGSIRIYSYLILETMSSCMPVLSKRRLIFNGNIN
jgi:hypothetical protein